MRRPPRWVWLGAGTVLALAVGIAFFLARQSPPSLVRSGACAGCSVLLITVDTLRSDRVGAFGGQGGLTPALDRLAEKGVRLTRAYSPAPLTLPSHASILTAVSPPVHGIRTTACSVSARTCRRWPPAQVGRLSDGSVRRRRRPRRPVRVEPRFDVYDDRYGEPNTGNPDSAERRAGDVIKPATDRILARPRAEQGNARPEPVDLSAVASAKAEGRAQPCFAWVHLYDSHDPYQAPQP